MQDGSKEQVALTCEQPVGTERSFAFSSAGRAAYVTGRRIRIGLIRCTFFKVAVFLTACEVVPRRVFKPSSSMDRVYLSGKMEAFFDAKIVLLHRLPRVAEALRSSAE